MRIEVQQVALKQVLFPSNSVFFFQLSFHQCSIFISSPPEAGTIGPLVVAVPRVSASSHAQENCSEIKLHVRELWVPRWHGG